MACFRLPALILLVAAGAARAQTFSISTVVGEHNANFIGDGDSALYAGLNSPLGMTMDSAGNLYIADANNNRVRKVSTAGIITTVAGGGASQDLYSGDGGPANQATLNFPCGVAVDSAGNVYIADYGNSVVRKVTPSGIISTYAGTSQPGYAGDGGLATSAFLSQPRSLAIDSAGNLYIADYAESRIRKVTPSGIITTFAGGVSFGTAAEGGPATKASVDRPSGLAFDSAGNLYVAASGDYVIRKITPAGVITTIAGGFLIPGYAGDGGPATSALFANPTGVAVDSAGTLYVSDPNSYVVRAVSGSGIIATIAGNGTPGYSGDGGPALAAELNAPSDLLAANGEVYVSDRANGVIRMLTGPPAILSGGIVPLFGTAPTIQPGSWVSIYGTNLITGATPLQWTGNFPTMLAGTTVTVDNKPAYLSYASSGLVNIQAPDDTARGVVNVTVTTPNGSFTAPVTLADQSPSFSLQGDGKHVAAIVLRADGSGAFGGGSYDVVGPAGNSLGYPTVPAKAGDSVVIFGLGFGPTSPPVPAGKVFSGAAPAVDPIQLSINGAPATPSFAGLSAAGLFQFNLTIPAGLGAGDLPLAGMVNGASTQANVVISIN